MNFLEFFIRRIQGRRSRTCWGPVKVRLLVVVIISVIIVNFQVLNVETLRLSQSCPLGNYFTDGCVSCWCDPMTGERSCENMIACPRKNVKCPMGKTYNDECGNECTCYENTGAIFCREKGPCNTISKRRAIYRPTPPHLADFVDVEEMASLKKTKHKDKVPSPPHRHSSSPLKESTNNNRKLQEDPLSHFSTSHHHLPKEQDQFVIEPALIIRKKTDKDNHKKKHPTTLLYLYEKQLRSMKELKHHWNIDNTTTTSTRVPLLPQDNAFEIQKLKLTSFGSSSSSSSNTDPRIMNIQKQPLLELGRFPYSSSGTPAPSPASPIIVMDHPIPEENHSNTNLRTQISNVLKPIIANGRLKFKSSATPSSTITTTPRPYDLIKLNATHMLKFPHNKQKDSDSPKKAIVYNVFSTTPRPRMNYTSLNKLMKSQYFHQQSSKKKPINNGFNFNVRPQLIRYHHKGAENQTYGTFDIFKGGSLNNLYPAVSITTATPTHDRSVIIEPFMNSTEEDSLQIESEKRPVNVNLQEHHVKAELNKPVFINHLVATRRFPEVYLNPNPTSSLPIDNNKHSRIDNLLSRYSSKFLNPPLPPRRNHHHHNHHPYRPVPHKYRVLLRNTDKRPLFYSNPRNRVPLFVDRIAKEFFKKPAIYQTKMKMGPGGKPELELNKVIYNHKEMIPKELVLEPGGPKMKVRFTPEAEREMDREWEEALDQKKKKNQALGASRHDYNVDAESEPEIQYSVGTIPIPLSKNNLALGSKMNPVAVEDVLSLPTPYPLEEPPSQSSNPYHEEVILDSSPSPGNKNPVVTTHLLVPDPIHHINSQFRWDDQHMVESDMGTGAHDHHEQIILRDPSISVTEPEETFLSVSPRPPEEEGDSVSPGGGGFEIPTDLMDDFAISQFSPVQVQVTSSPPPPLQEDNNSYHQNQRTIYYSSTPTPMLIDTINKGGGNSEVRHYHFNHFVFNEDEEEPSSSTKRAPAHIRIKSNPEPVVMSNYNYNSNTASASTIGSFSSTGGTSTPSAVSYTIHTTPAPPPPPTTSDFFDPEKFLRQILALDPDIGPDAVLVKENGETIPPLSTPPSPSVVVTTPPTPIISSPSSLSSFGLPEIHIKGDIGIMPQEMDPLPQLPSTFTTNGYTSTTLFTTTSTTEDPHRLGLGLGLGEPLRDQKKPQTQWNTFALSPQSLEQWYQELFNPKKREENKNNKDPDAIVDADGVAKIFHYDEILKTFTSGDDDDKDANAKLTTVEPSSRKPSSTSRRTTKKPPKKSNKKNNKKSRHNRKKDQKSTTTPKPKPETNNYSSSSEEIQRISRKSSLSSLDTDNKDTKAPKDVVDDDGPDPAASSFKKDLDWKSGLMSNICTVNPTSSLCLTYRSLCMLMKS